MKDIVYEFWQKWDGNNCLSFKVKVWSLMEGSVHLKNYFVFVVIASIEIT